MNTEDESPQVKGVVIITLPPPENPALGKTITAFTLSNSTPQQFQENPQNHHTQPLPPQLPIRTPSNSQISLPFRQSLLGRPRTLLTLLGISLIVLTLWASSSPNTVLELRNPNGNSNGNDYDYADDRDDDDKSKPNSLLFPLYHKSGIKDFSQEDVELKLGKFVDSDSRNVVFGLEGGVNLSQIQSVSAASTVLPINGDIHPNGLYYTSILVGNPPRPYFLDIDTGSDLTWIQCDAPCTSCAKGAHPYYKPTSGNLLPVKDSICVELQRNLKTGLCEGEMCHQCDYEIEYADHSSSMGVLVRDGLQLTSENESPINQNIVFGCAYDQQGLLLQSLTKTDGILGLSRGKISLPSQLASQGIVDNIMGHCLSPDAVGGGYMFLGYDYVPQGQMAWVPMLNDDSTNSYLAEVSRMTYGNKQLSLDGWKKGHGKIVFDSGSSYTYFTGRAYSDLVATLNGVSEKDLIQDTSDETLPICWRYKTRIRSVSDVKQFFKPLIMEFGRKWWGFSTSLKILPEGYLIISNKGNVCLGILDGSDVHDGSNIILGDISLRGQLIVYDNENQKIGWTQSDCIKPKPWRSKTQSTF